MQYRVFTAGELTEMADAVLKNRNVFTWRNNNIPQRGRPFRGLKGASDRIGYHMINGVFVACEIKTIEDRMSEDQKTFLQNVADAGGHALVYHQDKNGEVKMEEYILSKFNK
jgi:hypothetical protein